MKNSLLVYLLLISSLHSFSQVDLNAGLMAYYPFTGNANDASGNGNNPIFNNATLTLDRFGNPNSAYSFNGTDNFIRIRNSASLNSSNQISICAWVKIADFYKGTCHGNNIVMKGDADYQPGDYKIRFDDSYITNSQNCYLSTTDITHETFFGINSSLSSNTPFIQLNQWYSVVYTCDGVTAKIYVNCKLVGSGPANGITFTNNDDLFLGSLNNAQYPYWFHGTMDEIRIYKRAINEDEVKAYGDCSTPTFSCSNWLKTPSAPSSVKIGQLNIPGNKVTVEAIINRTAPYSPSQLWAGDIVSKHRDPTDVNYLLRPNTAEITTSNGYYKTPDIADIELNKTHHVAMVYDGSTLKFYRDGCLMSQIPATGNLVQNSWETSIGYFSPELAGNENFIGYINEVRIWNVARTQSQLQTYMNCSLPNPTTQPGLLAYYTFDNLKNKQGNAAWNGTLGGAATINETNPNCNAIVNNCPTLPPACNIIITKNADTTICAASPVKMFATGGTSFSWSPSTGLNNPNSSNPVATPSATTIYYVTVSNADGCSKNDSVKITVNDLPAIAKSNDTSICINSKVSLFASGGSSYTWKPSIGLDNTNIPNPYATPLSTTKYYVTVTSADGCSKADSVKITVNSLPVISKSNDTTVCVNSNVPLFAAGGTFYVWSPTATLSNSSIADPVASPLTSTIYTVKVTNGNGCSKTDSIKVGINPVALISKSNDTTICKNGSAKIFANGGNSYIWAPSSALDNSTSSSPVASPAATTVYHVNITDQYSCVYKDSIKVSVRPPATFSISPENSVCEKTQMQLLASGGDSYFWSPALFLNNRNINNPMVTPDSSITYFVFIKENTCNESATLSTRITVLPKPVVNATKSNEITCFLPSTQLYASGANQYIWSPSTGLDNPVMANPIASPPKTAVYTVTGKDINGCTNSDTISVKVDFDKNIFYGLPNSFTPNEDGLNDCFGVSHWGVVSQLEFSIYNRLGQRIFYTNNPKVCWDGTFNGEPQNPDVYVYLIKATMTCGKIDKKGTVTLLR